MGPLFSLIFMGILFSGYAAMAYVFLRITRRDPSWIKVGGMATGAFAGGAISGLVGGLFTHEPIESTAVVLTYLGFIAVGVVVGTVLGLRSAERFRR